MASGHANRANRPNTWLHRPATRRNVLTCQNLYMAYQHIEPEIDLVSRFARDGLFSETGKLKKVPVSLTDLDVFWTGPAFNSELWSDERQQAGALE